MTMNQKKALYAFGSPDREATVNRFCTLAELAPDPAVKRFFLAIARENEHPDRRPLVSLYVLQSPLRDGSISALRKGF